MTPGGVFVTGAQRTGTTLLERLLGGHPRLSILSQPFPLVFVEVKRQFLQSLGATPADVRYPLGHLFLEGRYTPADFAAFLSGYRPDAGALRRLFGDMAAFSGQYTRQEPNRVAAVLEALEPGDFAATAAQLYRAFATKPDADRFGGKETICEEFLPYLLDRGWACLVIVRDPRDVLASLNHGRGPEVAGRLKPTLFNLRNWRKSVAFALHLEAHPCFAWVRYEDLVRHPAAALAPVAAAAGVSPFSDAMLAAPLRDASGVPWSGNSSHGLHRGLSERSVGLHRGLLRPEVVTYIEAACYPELRCLGYPVSIDPADIPAVLSTFGEPYEIRREGLLGYSTDPAHVAAEIRRLALLHERPGEGTRPYFLFEDVHARLRRAVEPG